MVHEFHVAQCTWSAQLCEFFNNICALAKELCWAQVPREFLEQLILGIVGK